MRLSFHRRVQEETNEVVAWYEEQKTGLGDDFFAEVEDALTLLKANPTNYGFWLSSQTVRRIKLKRFPYDELFEIRPGYVRVLCLRHEKRHPQYGVGRR